MNPFRTINLRFPKQEYEVSWGNTFPDKWEDSLEHHLMFLEWFKRTFLNEGVASDAVWRTLVIDGEDTEVAYGLVLKFLKNLVKSGQLVVTTDLDSGINLYSVEPVNP